MLHQEPIWLYVDFIQLNTGQFIFPSPLLEYQRVLLTFCLSILSPVQLNALVLSRQVSQSILMLSSYPKLTMNSGSSDRQSTQVGTRRDIDGSPIYYEGNRRGGFLFPQLQQVHPRRWTCQSGSYSHHQHLDRRWLIWNKRQSGWYSCFLSLSVVGSILVWSVVAFWWNGRCKLHLLGTQAEVGLAQSNERMTLVDFIWGGGTLTSRMRKSLAAALKNFCSMGYRCLYAMMTSVWGVVAVASWLSSMSVCKSGSNPYGLYYTRVEKI